MAASDDVTRFRDKMRVLGFATEKPFFRFPRYPTFRSQGIDLVEGVDRGVAVPPGTPREVIRRIESAFLSIVKNREFRDEQMKNGFDPLAMGHEESLAYLKAKTRTYAEIAGGMRRQRRGARPGSPPRS